MPKYFVNTKGNVKESECMEAKAGLDFHCQPACIFDQKKKKKCRYFFLCCLKIYAVGSVENHLGKVIE